LLLDKLTLEVGDDDLFNMPAPQVPGKSSSSPKQSPKKLSPKKLLKTAASAPVPSKQTPAGFFPDNVLSLPAWMGGGESSKAAAAGSQGGNWLSGIGFATPHSTAEAASASSQTSAPTAPLPSAASAPPKLKIKRELVPSPRNFELTAESDIKEAAAAGVAKNSEEEEDAKQKAVEEAAYVGVGMRIQDDPPHKIVSVVPGELFTRTHTLARKGRGRQTDRHNKCKHCHARTQTCPCRCIIPTM
jgi:hypothetical protein